MSSLATPRPSLRRSRIAAALFVLLATCAAGKMHASSFTYDIVLTPNPGSLYGGTGILTVATAPSTASPNSQSTYTQAGGTLQDLSFNIDGQTFSLAGTTGALAQFTDGVLTDVTFAEQIGSSPYRFDLQTSGAYAFYYNNELSESSGTFTASAAPAPTPEPSSLLLLGTGALAGLGALRRKVFAR